ncbi:hypothetical protein BGW38_009237 [Lunasporangiospora selenospora]|uniref:Uncharacterized protein n=1 Tax=Lunasporangiospora selenospora TaxID=979761 RepID=A0A9P6FXG6_9FUNG|nr:hypothetical protein BGW38_009237 [Lunasporangiospora selenospora]
MPKDCCCFSYCRKGLLNKDRTVLAKGERDHVRRYHEDRPYTFGIKRVVFCVRRDPQRNMAYVCACDSQCGCIPSLAVHVMGSQHTTVKRKPCSKISEMAEKVLQSKEPLFKDDEPFKAWPAPTETPETDTACEVSCEASCVASCAASCNEGTPEAADRDDLQARLEEHELALKDAIEQLERATERVRRAMQDVQAIRRERECGRSIFSVTMDPNTLERDLNQAAQAMHSSVNSLLGTMQATVFGGLEMLSHEVSAFEKQSRAYLEQHPLVKENYDHYAHHFPWSLRSDGPKKRYRVTIEELPAEDPVTPAGSARSEVKDLVDGGTMTVRDGEDFTITQGKAGTADEGKTFITASVAPGLLDWLLFTTHEDSFFRRLGQKQPSHQDEYDVIGGARVVELDDDQQGQDGSPSKRLVPSLVNKVKQVGTTWEKGARHWWQHRGDHGYPSEGDASTPENMNRDLDRQHHLFSVHLTKKKSVIPADGPVESYSQTTVTRPDGTIEHRTANSVNGETETRVRIQYPDGSVEETVTRENNGSRPSHSLGFRDRWDQRRQDRIAAQRQMQEDALLHEGDMDRERDAVAAVVAEAIASEKEAHRQDQGSSKSRSWPPKSWLHRQERND